MNKSWIIAAVVCATLLGTGLGQAWDRKVLIHPTVWDVSEFAAHFSERDNSLHFLAVLATEDTWNYQYRRLDSGRDLSPWTLLTESFGKPESILLPSASGEILFFFQNNTAESGQGPLLYRYSTDNGKTWTKYFPIDDKQYPRSSLAAVKNPLNAQIWLYFFYFSPTHRVGYVTRPSGSTIFSAEKVALDTKYGHFMEGTQAVITFNGTVPVVHLFAVSERGLQYAYSKDGGLTYEFASVVAPLPDAYEAIADPRYGNQTVFVAVENELKWTSDFGNKWKSVKITERTMRSVSLAMCRVAGEWRVYYMGVADDDTPLFGFFKPGQEKFVEGKLPFEKADIHINPKVVCYQEGSRTRLGIVMGDANEGVKAYYADA